MLRFSLALVVGCILGPVWAADLYVGSYTHSSPVVDQFDGSSGQRVRTFTDANRGYGGGHGMAFGGPGGDLYAICGDLSNSSIRRFDRRSGDLKRVIADRNLVPSPFGLVVDRNGIVLVSDIARNCVLRFDGSNGEYLGELFPNGAGGLGDLRALSIGPNGNVYVCSKATNSVKKYDAVTGQYLGEGAVGGDLNDPDNLAFGPDGMLYVTSFGSGSILKFDPATGAFQSVFVPRGSGGLESVRWITFGPDGNLYACDVQATKVRKYHGTTGIPLGDFAQLSQAGPMGWGPGVPQPVLPQSFTVTRGVYQSGGVPELLEADDRYLYLGSRAPFTASAPSIQVVVAGQTEFEPTFGITADLESAVSYAAVRLDLELYDYVAGRWVALGSQQATSNDSLATFRTEDSPGRFIEQATGEIQLRISWFDRGVPFPFWLARVDYVRWTLD